MGRWLGVLFRWDGIIAALAEGIAAKYAPKGKQKPFESAVDGDRLYRVLRAGGGEAAAGRVARRDAALIAAYEIDEESPQ